MLPNFLVIGAMKGGTSSLTNYLREHPQVFMSKPKEIRFFGNEENWQRGLDWYEQHFADARDATAIGEASPNYTTYPIRGGVPARIAGVIPNAKLIYLVRHPIERMQSQYIMMLREGMESLPIEQALLERPIYVYPSRYALQLEQYLDHFSREQLLVLSSDALRHHRKATMRQVFQFLGIDSNWSPPNLDKEYFGADTRVRRPFASRVRRLPGYRSLSRLAPHKLKSLNHRLTTRRPVDPARAEINPELRRHLEDLLREDVRKLYTYMGNGFDGWGIA